MIAKRFKRESHIGIFLEVFGTIWIQLWWFRQTGDVEMSLKKSARKRDSLSEFCTVTTICCEPVVHVQKSWSSSVLSSITGGDVKSLRIYSGASSCISLFGRDFFGKSGQFESELNWMGLTDWLLPIWCWLPPINFGALGPFLNFFISPVWVRRKKPLKSLFPTRFAVLWRWYPIYYRWLVVVWWCRAERCC